MIEIESIFDLVKVFSKPQDYIDYLEKIRWNGNPISPYDPTSQVYPCNNNQYLCQKTGKRFNVKTGTPLQNTKISLEKWFIAAYFLATSEKGISSCKLAKHLKITQKSAWSLKARLQYACDIPFFKEILKGAVEIDETYIGGKNKNRHKNKKIRNSQGRSGKGKIIVWGGKERKAGRMILRVVSNAEAKTLVPLIRANIEKHSTIYSDEWPVYKDLGKWYNHEVVNHGVGEFARGDAHTNSLEGEWNQLKKMIYGTHHWISRKHAKKYMNEFAFRHNTRQLSDHEKFDLLLGSLMNNCGRLTYRKLINQPSLLQLS